MALLLERGYNGTQSGGREDLSDLISNVDAKSTVFTSMARKGKKPGNVLMSWQMDEYEAPSAAGTVDGTDVTAAALVADAAANPGRHRTLANNFAQIFRRSFRISSLANEIQIVAGVKSELANGIAKKLVEIKRDMELTFLNDADAQIDNGTNAYLTKSLGSFLHASGTGGGASDKVVDSDFRCLAATVNKADEVAEEDVQNMLKTIFENTGTIRDYDLLCGSALKRNFTSFTQSATGSADRLAIKTFNTESSAKAFINVIDVFEGDFGRLRLHPSTFIAESGSAVNFKGYVIPFDQVEIRYGKLPQIKELTDNGGGPARLIEAVAALIVYNPKAFGYYDCASAT